LGVFRFIYCRHHFCGYEPFGWFDVNSMQDAHHEDEHAEVLAHRDELMLRLDAIEKKLDRLSK